MDENGSAVGWKATEVFSKGVTYSYDDIILLPGYISFGADDVRKDREDRRHLFGIRSLWRHNSRGTSD